MVFEDTADHFIDPQCNELQIKELIHQALQDSIPGFFTKHPDYPVYCTKTDYYIHSQHEGLPIFPQTFPEVLLNWAGMDPDIPWSKDDLLVIDLETTGLGRGGILAFMIGLGYYEDDKYVVEQLFLPEPDAEINSFDRLMELLEQKSVLVTFNGKTFDLPVLESRFLHNQIWINFREKEHIDVLHIARRLWRKKAPSCALETLEYYILGQVREKELDIEGSLIPQTYFQFLINGDPEMIRRIFVHNQHDVLNTASLLAFICEHLEFPVRSGMDYRIDYHAVAKLYQSQGHHQCTQSILEDLTDQDILSADIVYDLGIIYKKAGDYKRAETCFRQGAELNDIRALHELVLILENKQKNYPEAIEVCMKLFTYLSWSYPPNPKKLDEAQKRLNRLQLKLDKQAALTK